MDVVPFDTTTVIRKETIQPLVLTQWLLHLFFRSSIQTYPFGTHHIWSTLPFLFLQSTVFTETTSIAQVTVVSLRHLVIFHRFSHRQWNIGQYLFFFIESYSTDTPERHSLNNTMTACYWLHPNSKSGTVGSKVIRHIAVSFKESALAPYTVSPCSLSLSLMHLLRWKKTENL